MSEIMIDKVLDIAIKRCRNELKILETLKKQLSEKSKSPFIILNLIEQLRTLNSPHAQELITLENELKQEVNNITNYYRELLNQALSLDNCIIEGKYPEYRINKIIKVIIDDKNMRVKIGTNYYLDTVEKDISIEVVAEKIREQIQRLFKRPFNPQEFINLLWKAYLLALVYENKPQRLNEHVSIFTLHKFVVWLKQDDKVFRDMSGKKFTPYLPDQFAVDIGKLLAEGITQTPQGYRLKIIPTRNPKEALYVINFKTGIGQNYGAIRFESEQKGDNI